MTFDFHSIKSALSSGLPGWEAQKLMSPVQTSDYIVVPEQHKKAAVLILILNKQGVPHICFIKRASKYPQDKHAGQISFPGGAYEDSDSHMLACAKRETFEEIGITADQYEVLGELTSLYVYVSNFLVYPFLAYTDQDLIFSKQDDEVDDLIIWPLEDFIDYKIKKTKDLSIRNTILKDIPYFDLDGEVLWGATSMILSELIKILEKK